MNLFDVDVTNPASVQEAFAFLLKERADLVQSNAKACNERASERDTLRAQLAEAVGLLRRYQRCEARYNGPDCSLPLNAWQENNVRNRAFLARVDGAAKGGA